MTSIVAHRYGVRRGPGQAPGDARGVIGRASPAGVYPGAIKDLPSGMRVLFIGPTRIGDAVLSSGALAWLLARWPEARLTVAAGPAAAPRSKLLLTSVGRPKRRIAGMARL